MKWLNIKYVKQGKSFFAFPAKPRITCLSLLENTVEGGNCNRTIEKEEGDYFLVQCKAKAIPPAKYKWEKSNIDATTGVETWGPIPDRIIKVIVFRFVFNFLY